MCGGSTISTRLVGPNGLSRSSMMKCPAGPPVPAFVEGSAARVTGMSPLAAQWRPT